MKWDGRSVNYFFFAQVHIRYYRYFWILVAEAGKMLCFVPIFSVHDTENNFAFEVISSFILKVKNSPSQMKGGLGQSKLLNAEDYYLSDIN